MSLRPFSQAQAIIGMIALMGGAGPVVTGRARNPEEQKSRPVGLSTAEQRAIGPLKVGKLTRARRKKLIAKMK